MGHWILTRDRAQAVVANLDLNLMTLKAAKLYYSAYGVIIKGSSKKQFIKNLMSEVGNND